MERLPENADCLPLDAYIDCVLYHPEIGYYRRDKARVGRSREADFYTASSLGPLFSQLVLASIRELLGQDLSGFTFIEAGPESPEGILGQLDDHPFEEVRLIRPGEPFKMPAKAVLFSNELFDAQPFKRFIRARDSWLEAGVAIAEDGLRWTTMERTSEDPDLPENCPQGYTIDWPASANRLLREIASQPWEGLFLAFDYGLDRSTVFRERPQGTARTYSAHAMGSDLLENPGQIDITCHIVWDELEDILRDTRFHQVELARQEAFFMRNGQTVIKDVLESGPAGFSMRKQTLMELLHPANMGHKFQVLSALRTEL